MTALPPLKVYPCSLEYKLIRNVQQIYNVYQYKMCVNVYLANMPPDIAT